MLATTEKQLSQLKSLSDPVKVRLATLCSVIECSVSELTEVTTLSQPRVSQHLKQLCDVGLLQRFRDGHFVYYGVADDAPLLPKVLGLLPSDEPQFAKDLNRLRTLRVGDEPRLLTASEADRSLHRALVELTVAHPIGDLLDIGCGQGRLLKLLASRAHRVVGVDIDSNARRLARAEMLLSGTANCTLRQGDMYALPFADSEFDTIILDDVLAAAVRPRAAIKEAIRLLAPGGRIFVVAAIDADNAKTTAAELALLSAACNLRLAQPRPVPNINPIWLLAVASVATQAAA